MPEFVLGTDLNLTGDLQQTEDGSIYYHPAPETENLYIFGHNSLPVVDWIGLGVFLLVVLGVMTHGGFRIYFGARNPQEEHSTKKVYMYSAYERLWHWLQTERICGTEYMEHDRFCLLERFLLHAK